MKTRVSADDLMSQNARTTLVGMAQDSQVVVEYCLVRSPTLAASFEIYRKTVERRDQKGGNQFFIGRKQNIVIASLFWKTSH